MLSVKTIRQHEGAGNVFFGFFTAYEAQTSNQKRRFEQTDRCSNCRQSRHNSRKCTNETIERQKISTRRRRGRPSLPKGGYVANDNAASGKHAGVLGI